MSSTFDNLIFRSGKNGVTFQIFSDIGCRKSKPSVDQKATEECVLSIHKQLMVIGAYQSLSYSLDVSTIMRRASITMLCQVQVCNVVTAV